MYPSTIRFSRDIFRANPVMPGVLIVENGAGRRRSSAGRTNNQEGKLVLFMSMNNVKFRKQVVPGDQLVYEVKMVYRKPKLCQIAGKAMWTRNLWPRRRLMAR